MSDLIRWHFSQNIPVNFGGYFKKHDFRMFCLQFKELMREEIVVRFEENWTSFYERWIGVNPRCRSRLDRLFETRTRWAFAYKSEKGNFFVQFRTNSSTESFNNNIVSKLALRAVLALHAVLVLHAVLALHTVIALHTVLALCVVASVCCYSALALTYS